MFAVQWVLEHTILHLLTAISDRDVAKQGCEILKEVIRGTNAAGNSKFLTNLLGEIICTLIPQATHCQPPDGAVSDNLPLDIISTELVRAHMPSILRDWCSGDKDERVHWTKFPHHLAGFDNQRDFVEQCAAPTLVPEILLDFASNKNEVFSELKKIGDILCRRDRSHTAITYDFYAHIYSRLVGCSGDPSMQAKAQGLTSYIKEHMKNARRNTPPLHLTLRLLDLILDGCPTRWDPLNERTHWTTQEIKEAVVDVLKKITPKGDPELYLLGIRSVGPSGASQTQTASLGGDSEDQSPNDLLPQVYLHLLKALKGQGGRKVTRQQKERVLWAVGAVVECLGSLLSEKIATYPVR